MRRQRYIGLSFAAVLCSIALIVSSCSPSMHTLSQIPVFKVNVKAVDTEGDPMAGAIVETSKGGSTSTDSTGMAQVSFGAAGVYTVSVMADNRAPSTFTVTMPANRGDTLTARLGQPVTYDGGMAFMQGSFSHSQFYPMMFNWMFSTYGYNMDLTEYEAGQWTEWRIATSDDDDDQITMRKAFLKENDEGQQWWQVKMIEQDQENPYIVEVLFSEDRSSIRRIREQFGEEEPSERPVSEGWYTQPQQLTPESIEGAVTEEGVSAEVPAGTFETDRLNFGVAPDIDLMLWRTDQVPGGVVKYTTQSGEDDMMYESTLLDHGTGAETELNSY